MISYIVLLLNLMRHNTVFNNYLLTKKIAETRALQSTDITGISTDPYSKQNREQNQECQRSCSNFCSFTYKPHVFEEINFKSNQNQYYSTCQSLLLLCLNWEGEGGIQDSQVFTIPLLPLDLMDQLNRSTTGIHSFLQYLLKLACNFFKLFIIKSKCCL